MSIRGHETLDHTADMGIQGWGRTPAEAFEEIAAAMFELTVDAHGLAASRRVSIAVEGIDLTELLLVFLNTLLSQADITGTVFLKSGVSALEKRGRGWILETVAEGVPLEEARDRLLVEVKAATYCGASVTENKTGAWVARCVVDL
jgi:SHS2 domain-containing protein